eukprot:scpid87368/ scgid26902/ Mono- and diacylglycerol lipase; Mono- and diacylglycerol lipase
MNMRGRLLLAVLPVCCLLSANLPFGVGQSHRKSFSHSPSRLGKPSTTLKDVTAVELVHSTSRSAVEPFNMTLARYLVVVSRITYDTSLGDILDLSCRKCRPYRQQLSGFRLSRTLESVEEDTLAIVGVDQRLSAIVVAFRGSTTLRNWWNNLQFLAEPLWSGSPCAGYAPRVHAGFKASYAPLRSQLLAEVARLVSHNPGAKRILVTGHSLGGALSTLAALDLSAQHPGHQLAMYSFGAPVVGNPAFAQCYERLVTNSHRVVHRSDVVTTFVPGGFKHVPREHVEFFALRLLPDFFILSHTMYLGVYCGM